MFGFIFLLRGQDSEGIQAVHMAPLHFILATTLCGELGLEIVTGPQSVTWQDRNWNSGVSDPDGALHPLHPGGSFAVATFVS